MLDFIMNGPKIYGHEHIGSLTSFGTDGAMFHVDAYRGYEENRTTLFDLIFSPYLYGKILQVGNPPREYGAVKECLKRLDNLGFVRALDIALRDLYGSGIEEMDEALDRQVQANYSRYYAWYEQVMEKMKCEKVIRTVHPHYLEYRRGGWETEEKYNVPLIRVDTLLGYPENGGMNYGYFEKLTGKKLRKLEDFEDGVKYLFDLTDARGVAGLKQFQAYFRTLRCPEVKRENAMDSEQSLQDYLMHRIYRLADQRHMVFQIHTGMTNLANSNPMLLEPLFAQYPNIRFVLLHAYPYVSEAAFLAACYPNVYVDTSWLVLHGENILEKALREYLGMAPYEKILISTDSTNLEEFYGSHVMTARTLARVLESMEAEGIFARPQCEKIARSLMYENSKRLYLK